MIHTWLNRYQVAHPKHIRDLELAAAVNEFGHKQPRHEAELAAHQKYVTEQRTQAAGWHLAGMKAAHAAGDMESAQKHGAMYQIHMTALGLNPNDRPPAEVDHAARNATK